MEINRRTIKKSVSKTKIGLCLGGIVICVLILVAASPMDKNRAVDVKAGAVTNSASLVKLGSSGHDYAFQAAAAAGQGSSPAMQGPKTADNPAADNSPTESAGTEANLPQLPVQPICRWQGLHPMVGYCERLICPDSVFGCSPCTGTANYACLIEE